MQDNSRMKVGNRLRASMRVMHLSLHTEESYVRWQVRLVKFHSLRNPETMGAAEMEAFLTCLTVERDLSGKGLT